jgi:hypothetical protein
MPTKRLKIAAATAIASLLAVAGAASAHHSFSATYLEDREITIEGELAAFMYRNPHSFVHVMAPDEHGDMQRWSVEWAGAAALSGEVARDTLKPGERVVVSGNPGRSAEDFRMRLRRISRPADGWEWAGNFD